MSKFFGHLKTITRHRHLVMKFCFKAGIGFQGLFHDLSKYSCVEFWSGVKYYTDGSQSPNNGQRKKYGYSKAWLHHKGRNKHHFEYWVDILGSQKEIRFCKMPLNYVKEMFCDRLAATKIYLKDAYTQYAPLEYYLARNEENYMHKDTANLLQKLLIMLAQDGEDATFKYIKGLKNKDYETQTE